jgi:hypothetical protein
VIQAAVFSIVGWHAGESVADIIKRKNEDIKGVGFTLWLYHSRSASPSMVRDFATQHPDAAVVFLLGAAYPTTRGEKAQAFSDDRVNWKPLAANLGPVTGKLPAIGLVIDQLEATNGHLDTWDYVDFPKREPLRFQRGASTVCAVRSLAGPIPGMKARSRIIAAVGRLRSPYAVFLR